MIDMAFAQTGGGEGGGPLVFILQFLPFILVFVIFYFLLIRPQSQRQKALQAMIKDLKRGDRVVTSGGIKGSVVDIKEDSSSVVLKVAENIKMEFTKQSVVAVETKGSD
jgi:preprotein translocase subunit YajC